MKKYNKEQLRQMDEPELRLAISEMDEHLQTLHYDANGDVRDLTDDESKSFDQTAVLRDVAVRLLQVKETFRKNPKSTERAYGGLITNRNDAFDGDALRMGADAVRDAALHALDARSDELSTEKGDHLNEVIRQRITRESPNIEGSYIARRLLLTESDDYRSAFRKMLTRAHPIYSAGEAQALSDFEAFEARTAMSESGGIGTGLAGVPVFIDPTINLTAQGSENPVLQLASVRTITTNAWKGVSSAGVSWQFQAEAVEVNDNSPTLAQPVINVHRADGWVPFSIEVGMDYPGFAEEMQTLLTSGYGELLAQKLVTGAGDGSNEPLGLVTQLAADTTVQVTLTTGGTVAAADINHAWEQLPSRFKPRSSWVMGYGTADDIAALGNSNNLSFVTVDLTKNLQTLRTRPVYNSPYVADLVNNTTAQNVAVVGDFGQYVVAQRAGMAVEMVQHVVGTNHRPTGQRGFFAWARVGAGCITTNGFRLLVNKTS